jgi:hypothetical protein
VIEHPFTPSTCSPPARGRARRLVACRGHDAPTSHPADC